MRICPAAVLVIVVDELVLRTGGATFLDAVASVVDDDVVGHDEVVGVDPAVVRSSPRFRRSGRVVAPESEGVEPVAGVDAAR